MTRRTFTVSLGVACLFASLTALHAQTPPTRPRDGAIVYTTLQPYNLDIYLRDEPGAPLRRVTDHQANDYNATFSPDGRWLVFCSERNGNPDLFAIDLIAGGEPVQLTSSRTMEDAPAFSPDGSTIVFVSDRHGTADIFKMPFDPTDPNGDSRAVNLTSHDGGDFNPVFSPDGRWIAFSSDRHFPPSSVEYWRQKGEGSEIFVMDAAGRNVTRLTHVPGWDGSPAWSADGANIYFYSQRDTSVRIWRMAADGTDQRPVTDSQLGAAVSPAMAPGGRIGFSVGGKIFAMAPDGSELRQEDLDIELSAPAFDLRTGRLADHADAPVEQRILRADGRPFAASGTVGTVRLRDREVQIEGIYPSFPSFDATGSEIVAAHSAPGDKDLYLMDVDGANVRRLTHDSHVDTMPALSPDGAWVVFSSDRWAPPGTADFDLFFLQLRPDGLPGASARGWLPGMDLIVGTTGPEVHPRFSPDVRWIVYSSAQGGLNDEPPLFDGGPQPYGEIWALPFPSGAPVRLTHNKWEDSLPDWSDRP